MNRLEFSSHVKEAAAAAVRKKSCFLIGKFLQRFLSTGFGGGKKGGMGAMIGMAMMMKGTMMAMGEILLILKT